MHRRHHLRAVLARADFRRLLAVRLAGQTGDGVFQASLAGAVLFSPERSATAADIAAGFAVILLPYSVVGPFAGVLLDRWWRQRVLVVANVFRALAVLAVGTEILFGVTGQPFYASALVVVSVNRFVLAALPAALPHVIEPEELVTANSLSTTLGGVVATIGGASAIGTATLINDPEWKYAAIAFAAAVPYLAAAWFARGFARDALGPDDVERSHRETAGDVARGLVDGARHVRSHRPAFAALAAIAAHRFTYGIATVATVLLYRNYFTDDGFFRAGLDGLAQVIGAVAAGAVIAALVTPAAARRFGFVGWSAGLLLLAAVMQITLGLPFQMPLILLGSLLAGFVAQGVKICVDTVLQQSISDEFRGRVFSLYDTLFNVMFVAAATVSALLLPEDGHAPLAVLGVGLAYATIGLLYRHLAAGTPKPTGATEPTEPAPARPS